MRLEELILKCLTEDSLLAAKLAVFEDRPAVFYRNAPDDGQEGWDASKQYPRIVFRVDMQASQERKSAGTVKMSLMCKEADTVPEDIEPLIRLCMENLLIQPDQSPPCCLSWYQTKDLAKASGEDSAVWGIEITYDLLSFPSQESTDPDPVTAWNRYMKETIPQAFILGFDQMKHYTKAFAETPVFYCRLESLEKGQVTNTAAWIDGKVAIHVLCPSEEARLKWAMELVNALALEEEIIMLDGSPMRVKGLQVNYKADYLKDGQIVVTGQYGLLRYRNQPHMVTEIYMDI